ncbi:MAG: transposase zinc-binding domain-containing protein [Lachnospiraceae bacterium]|nr:transposase zinc-binding domain-containing protein [Lachnospiraceae bacterium]
MNDLKIQQVWNYSYTEFSGHHTQSLEQLKTSHAIRNCKTGILGATISQCSDCGHIVYHNNSCRNRNCPNCQTVKKNSGWINAEPKSLTRRIFMWSLRFHTN